MFLFFLSNDMDKYVKLDIYNKNENTIYRGFQIAFKSRGKIPQGNKGYCWEEFLQWWNFSMNCVYREYRVKIKMVKGQITTATNEVFIGL